MRIFSVTNFQPLVTILSHLAVFLFWWAVASGTLLSVWMLAQFAVQAVLKWRGHGRVTLVYRSDRDDRDAAQRAGLEQIMRSVRPVAPSPFTRVR